MLEKALFWRTNSTKLTSDLNSVNNVFTRLIKKLEVIQTKLLQAKEKNYIEIVKLQTENDKLSDIDNTIIAQIDKYKNMMV